MTNQDYFILFLVGALIVFAAFLGHIIGLIAQSLA